MSGAVNLRDGESLSEARHNLRTPINHILGYGEMLMEDAEDQGREEFLPDLRRILEDGKLALAVINGALSPAGNEVGETELRAMRDELLGPVNQILDSIRRIEVEFGPGDAAKIRAAAELLLTIAAEILLEPGTPAQPRPEIVVVPIALEVKAADRLKPVLQGRLLVVDDNEANRDVLGRRLEREGYQVSSAENGRQALEMVRATSFDLVLLDIMMPEIDGYQVLSQMKADPALRDIPVIMISALDEIKSVVRCIETGAEDYLNKPFDPVLLRARIGASLEKKRLRDEQKRKTAELEVAIEEAETQRRESESLLRNILPAQIADELRAGPGRAALLRGCDHPVFRFRRVHPRHRESGGRRPGEPAALLLHRVRPHCRTLRPGKTQDHRRQLHAGGRAARAESLAPGGCGDGRLRDGESG